MQIGASLSVEELVTPQKTARAVGSGTVEVYATPMMAALCENAAMQLAQSMLSAEQTTVGIQVEMSHLAATPVGMKVRATATLTAAEGRTLTFSMRAEDECGLIGEGTQRRAIVGKASFEERAQKKKNG